MVKSNVPLVHSHTSEPCFMTRRGNETFEGVKVHNRALQDNFLKVHML